MAISDSSDDWLKTPGIATRSIKEIEAVPINNRWRKAVVLGFRGSASDLKIKENHERHMNNLKERYMEMKVMKEDVKVEEKQDVKQVNKDLPSFGTKSTFCDKNWKKVIGGTRFTAARSFTPINVQPSEQLKFDPPSTPPSPKDRPNDFNGFANKHQKTQQNQHHFKKPSAFKGFTLYEPQPIAKPIIPPPFRGPICTRKFEGFANNKLQSEPNDYSIPLHIETDPSKMVQQDYTFDPQSLPKIRSWNIDPISKFGVYTGVPPMTRISDSSQSSFGCSTPNESQLCSPNPSPSPNCAKDSFPVFASEKEIVIEKRSDEILFDIVSDTKAKTVSGCVNPTVKEKIRRYNKEPTAAGKRYLKPLDIVNNSAAHQLQTQIKFDKNRVKRWVARFQSFRPSVDPTSCRRRRYSNTEEDIFPNCPNSDNEGEREDKLDDVGMAEETFAKMCLWIGDVKWKVKDNDRITFPKEGSTIIVRVLSSRDRRAIVVPSDRFNQIQNESKQFIILNRPPRIPNDFMRRALVLLEKDSDEMGQKEYRRGWMFDGNEREVRVLLFDEKRIVLTTRCRLFLCPDPVVMDSPPLCVTATFHRELMAHEKELLLEMGCSAKCRVMNDSQTELKLRLSRINAEGHSLDIMFCGEECAGACYHHKQN